MPKNTTLPRRSEAKAGLSQLIEEFLEYLEIDPTLACFSPFQYYSYTARRALRQGKEKIVL